jgi:hypothetical protein
MTDDYFNRIFDRFEEEVGDEGFSAGAAMEQALDEDGIYDPLLREEAHGGLDHAFNGDEVDSDSPTGPVVTGFVQAWRSRYGNHPYNRPDVTDAEFYDG